MELFISFRKIDFPKSSRFYNRIDKSACYIWFFSKNNWILSEINKKVAKNNIKVMLNSFQMNSDICSALSIIWQYSEFSYSLRPTLVRCFLSCQNRVGSNLWIWNLLRDFCTSKCVWYKMIELGTVLDIFYN